MDGNRDYRSGYIAGLEYTYTIRERVEKAADAGVRRIIDKMHECPGATVFAYYTKPGATDSEVIAVVQGDPIPQDAALLCDEAIQRVGREYIRGFLIERLRAAPMLASVPTH